MKQLDQWIENYLTVSVKNTNESIDMFLQQDNIIAIYRNPSGNKEKEMKLTFDELKSSLFE